MDKLAAMLLLAPLTLLAHRSANGDDGAGLLPPNAGSIESHPTVQTLRAENSALKANAHKLEAYLLEARSRGAEFATHPGQMWPHVTSRNANTAFSKERLEEVAGGPGRGVILTFVNSARLDFARTWASHVRRLGLTNWLIGATDQDALHALLRDGTPCFDMHTHLPAHGEWAWGSPSFHSLGPHKIEMIYQTLTWGLELVITDVDAPVLREPFAYMARWPDAGFLTTSDHLWNTTSDGGLEDHRAIHSAYNIGYMFFRASAIPLVEEWRKVIKEDQVGRWDQGEFSRLVRVGWDPSDKGALGLSDPRLFRAYHKQVVGGVLSLTLFCGGHNYFVSQFAQRLGWQPYSIHTTFQYGAAEGKRHRLREAMVWEDPPEYYDPPGGLLTYTADVPEALLSPPGGMRATGHIALIEHQLKQIAAALGLAAALGRVLILPAVTCGYDKAWYGLGAHGEFGGANAWVVPIRNCPLDHYLETGELTRAKGVVGYVREWSLLANPRTPAAVLESAAEVSVVHDGGAAELQRLRDQFGATKVLAVTNLAQHDLFRSGLLGDDVRATLRRRFPYVSGSWCCAPERDRKAGMPNSHSFHLPIPSPQDVQHWSADDEPLDGDADGTSVVEKL